MSDQESSGRENGRPSHRMARQWQPALRVMSAFSTSQLHGLIGKALLEADKQRAVALDGDSQVNVRRIHTQHVKAATWQTEIILRSIFN